jgi:hypothetical protein
MTNTFDRESLISDYINQVIEDMDMDTLMNLAFDHIYEIMMSMNDNAIVNEVNEYHPDLLKEHNIDPDIYI